MDRHVSLLEISNAILKERERLRDKKKWWQSNKYEKGLSKANKIIIELGRIALKEGRSIG